jgi:hypothetical protein
MTRNRIIIFYCLLGALVLGHLGDLLLHREHWPFSSYAMFASITPAQYSVYELDGLAVEGGVRKEVALDLSLVPILPVEVLQTVLTKAANEQKTDPRRLHQLVGDYLSMYNQRRRALSRDEPPLAGLRLYQVELPMAAALALTPSDPPPNRWVRHLAIEVDEPQAMR